MLLVKKQFLDAIRSGAKTQTVRCWPFRRMRAGQRSYIPGAGYIDVTAVDEVSLDELTEEDAIRDGFASLAELRSALQEIYSDAEQAQQTYRVRFRLLDEQEQAVAKAERQRRKTAAQGR
ncbi:MAG: ASCH domain-containing protein [Planctomycetales bacterium]|nr:ASCH domain-containing protein [Planctomycetales bacterium]